MTPHDGQRTADSAPIRERLSRLTSALVCDILDSLGYRNAFVGPGVLAIEAGTVLAGHALPLQAVAAAEASTEPYRHLFAAYDEITPGTVVLIASADGRSGLWGELLSLAARARGAVGIVTDGLVRDVDQMQAMGFPVFARGATPLDSAGRQEIVGVSDTIVCGEATIHRGDFILGDSMGVVVIPRAVIEELLELAEKKAMIEATVGVELERGDDPADVFARYHTL